MGNSTHETSEVQYLFLHQVIECSQWCPESMEFSLEASRASRMCNPRTAVSGVGIRHCMSPYSSLLPYNKKSILWEKFWQNKAPEIDTDSVNEQKYGKDSHS